MYTQYRHDTPHDPLTCNACKQLIEDLRLIAARRENLGLDAAFDKLDEDPFVDPDFDANDRTDPIYSHVSRCPTCGEVHPV